MEQNKIKLDSTNENEYKTGVFSGTQKGYGFLIIEGEKDDVFIPEPGVNGAFNGDVVMIKLNDSKTGKRREGNIVKILERKTVEVVGTYQKSQNFGFVLPDNHKLGQDIFIPKTFAMNAQNGQKVVAKITDYGEGSKNPEGKITEILGFISDPGVDILSVIKAYDLPLQFPKEVKRQINSVPKNINEEDRIGRTDIRNLQTVTIDGEDAKDLDDAISISKKDGIYTLGVHIADVTHYVTENSAIDKEAYKRGTSVYLIDRVIPMLPPELSNGICSLNVGEDRLALSCFIDIDEKGSVIGHKIAETVVNVNKRMSYTSVAKIIDENNPEEIADNKNLIPMLLLMAELAKVLKEKRNQRGSINFDFPESMITLDKDGVPIDIKAYERNTATNIIEEFMLITNETIAENYFWQELPFVYRTHEKPDSEKIKALEVFINNFGYYIKVSQDEVHPKEIQKLLATIDGTAEEAIISRLTLRSMKQAKYTTANTGHFGLSAKYYCHFTAPIRRYPDLQIHRIIKENIKGKLLSKRIGHYSKKLDEVANHSSKTERVAEECEREVDKMKKVQYMKKFIGESFDGIISGITSWGIYVELANTVEGMIHVNNMDDDYYFYDEEHYQMVGKDTNNIYKLGQKIKVELIGADIVLRTIDFKVMEV
ncbi:MAG TPA: ribonuclease R [Clostridiales bacterium]|nr:ribonuclease R [Clostridiales bacterium]